MDRPVLRVEAVHLLRLLQRTEHFCGLAHIWREAKRKAFTSTSTDRFLPCLNHPPPLVAPSSLLLVVSSFLIADAKRWILFITDRYFCSPQSTCETGECVDVDSKEGCRVPDTNHPPSTSTNSISHQFNGVSRKLVSQYGDPDTGTGLIASDQLRWCKERAL